MTLLNILLILCLTSLAALLFLLLKGPKKTILIRWSLFLTLLCLVTGLLRFVVYKEDHAATAHKPLSSIAPSGYSAAFSLSFEKLCSAYYSLSDVLATGNTDAAEKKAIELKMAMDSFDIEELVADTLKYDAVYLSLENAGAETTAIISDPDVSEKRASFNILSQELFNLLTLLNILQPPCFRLICRDAFGKGNEGWWIGKSADAPNPYDIAGCSESQLIKPEGQPFIK